MKFFYCILSVVLGMSFLSGCAQINRDNLRYSSVKRGNEVYKVVNEDSLTAAEKHNKEAIELYKEHLKAYREKSIDEKEGKKVEKQQKDASQNDDKKDMGEKKETTKDRVQDKIFASDIKFPGSVITPPPAQSNDSKKEQKISPSAIFSCSDRSDMEIFWPKDFLVKAIDSNSKLDDNSIPELLRALSSTASIAQMRDLLTEPSFPALLPVERNVELGCLPPPDSAAFEAVSKLSANLKQQGIDVGVSGEFASSVVKLFEESERTLFLQYALFRLCEMSVNAPSEFRNVYPVIIHDIVRRTAEMNQLATIEVEKRKTEEEKTKQLQLQVEIQKTKPDEESLYQQCIKTKLFSGLSENEKIISECKKLIESK